MYTDTKQFEVETLDIPISKIKVINRMRRTDENRIADLAQSIGDLISNPKKRIKYGMNGRKIVESEFNWESQEEKLLLQYKNNL